MDKHIAVLGSTLKAGFFTSLALAVGAGVAAGGAVSSVLSNKRKEEPAQAPAASAAADIQTAAKDTASEDALAKRRKRTNTVLTGPRGLLSEPLTEKKQLLGQG